MYRSELLSRFESVDEAIAGLAQAQLLTYFRLSGMKVGLLMNFNVPVLKDGIVPLVL